MRFSLHGSATNSICFEPASPEFVERVEGELSQRVADLECRGRFFCRV
jgi:hypothetical protein